MPHGASWSVAWGDSNNDGFYDLWMTNHVRTSSLYLNYGGETFVDYASQRVSNHSVNTDQHGSAWADYDNDGDMELIVLAGAAAGLGEGSNHLFNNEFGIYTDIAENKKIDFLLGRGRMPLWVDLNNDGLLDVILNNAISPNSPGFILFCQNSFAQFEKCYVDINDISNTHEFSILGDIIGGNELEIISFPKSTLGPIYSTDTLIKSNIEVKTKNINVFQPIKQIKDAAVGDLNGDLKNDMILARYFDGDALTMIGDDLYGVKIGVNGSQKKIFIPSSNNLSIDFYLLSIWWNKNSIYTGNSGYNLGNCNAVESVGYIKCTLSLSLSNTDNHGIYKHIAGEDTGIFIGYNIINGGWDIVVSSDSARTIHAKFALSQNITSPILTNNFSKHKQRDSYVLINHETYFESSALVDNLTGLPTDCHNVVLADFDNDMDIDAIFACREPIINHSMKIYWNNGEGKFERDTHLYSSVSGLSDSITMGDYNNDGFIDILISNGFGAPPFNGGRYQLFNNRGNNNNWVEIDLTGNTSNRGGLGAVVYVTSGGNTQRRDMNGGVHNRGQNMSRLHFGLGNYNNIDKIRVVWPSGKVSILTDINVNQIININES
ncbi:MAG: CRTAC1 family protein [Methylococcales bacterium]|nr:CRTAC1 family protein [Methylococcales bacterium]